MLFSPAVCWWAYTQIIREPEQHRTNCISMASLGNTGFKQIANKLVIYLATELSSLALMYNTHESLVTKTWDWLKSAINMQNFKITVHGLQRQWLWKWLEISTALLFGKSMHFALVTCLFLYTSVRGFQSGLGTQEYLKKMLCTVLPNCYRQPHFSRTCHRNAYLSDLAVTLNKINKSLENSCATTLRHHI